MKKLMLVFLMAVALHAGDDKGLTGQFYQNLPETVRTGYASGFVNGYLQGQFFAADVIHRASLNGNLQHTVVAKMTGDVLSGMLCLGSGTVTNGQMAAILDKYIADHPESWDKPLSDLAKNAFIDACEKRAKKP